MQEQSCQPSPQPLPGKQILPGLKKDLARSRTAGRKAATARLTKRGAQEQTIQRQQEPGRQSPSPHPPVAHAWFVVFSRLTASGQRTEVTALVTASDHESGKGDHVTDDLPDEHMDANALTETDSGQKPQPVTPRAVQARPAAVRIPQPVTPGHLARANTTRSTAVRRPQSITT